MSLRPMSLPRRILLLLPLVLAACGDDSPRSYPPLRSDFLTPLRLNVATVEFAPLPPPGAIDASAPYPPGPALQQLAQDRVSAGGSSGRALVTIEEAFIQRRAGGLDGRMAIRLDITAADGARAGFAEARVSRRVNSPDGNLRTALYDITRRMLDDMNVELEFQTRSALRDYLQVAGNAAPPAPVQAEDLPALPGGPRAASPLPGREAPGVGRPAP